MSALAFALIAVLSAGLAATSINVIRLQRRVFHLGEQVIKLAELQSEHLVQVHRARVTK